MLFNEKMLSDLSEDIFILGQQKGMSALELNEVIQYIRIIYRSSKETQFLKLINFKEKIEEEKPNYGR